MTVALAIPLWLGAVAVGLGLRLGLWLVMWLGLWLELLLVLTPSNIAAARGGGSGV